MSDFISGFILGISLIIAIGPQNIFIIQQAVKREHALLSATLCFVCDCILITASVLGATHLLTAHPDLKLALLILGVAFLIGYGFKSISDSGKQTTVDINARQHYSSRFKIILFALSFSLLNPQAIIDSAIMVGGAASQLSPEHQTGFLIGTLSASFFWFYSLNYTAGRFANVLAQPKIFAKLQLVSGILMLLCALRLLIN